MSTANLRPISVLHVSTARTWRGGEQQVAYLISELSVRHISQVVLCTKDSAMQEYCSANKIAFETSSKGSAFDSSFARRIARVCKQAKVDIIHTHDSHAHTFALMSHLFFGCKADIVVSRRVDFPIGTNPFSKFKYNHKSVKRIICVSDAIRKITAEGLRDPAKAVTVHSGIDTSRFDGLVSTGILHHELKLKDAVRIVGNVAAIAPHKDYYTFVDAVEIMQHHLSDAVYVIIGDGPERANIEKYIRTKQLSDKIYLTGFRKDIPAILPELDVMLITSETEGLGTSILDAFACKVPVVATAAGGIPEIVIHNHTGLLAPVKDARSLALNVQKIIEDSELRKTLTTNATQHLRNFSKSHTASATMTEYLALAGSDL